MPDPSNQPVGEPSPFEVEARKHEAVWLGAILALTAVVYSSTLSFGFALDDWWHFVQNEWVQSWRYVPGYFAGHVWPHLGNNPPQNYYRPLDFVFLRIVNAVVGLRPAGWHAAALLLHLFVTFLAYWVLRRVTGRVTVAAAATLTFAIHPVRHEVVAWVTGTAESLWSVFFLLAFLAYLESRKAHRWRWMPISCVLYAAALLSKEPAILLPVIVGVHIWLYGIHDPEKQLGGWRIRFREALRVALVYVPVAIAYLVARRYVLRAFSHPKVDISAGQFLLTLPSVAFFYVRQWLVPDRASEFYSLLVQTRFTAANVLLPFLALLAIAALLWLGRDWLGRRELIFALVWMGLLVLPAFDLAVFPPTELVHDRYIYLPSLGASLLAGLALEKLTRGPVVLGFPTGWLAAVLFLSAVLSFETVDAVQYWHDDYVVLEHGMLYSPNDPLVHNLLSVTLASMGRGAYLRGEWAAAERDFQEAKSLDPMAADNYLQLGMVNLNTGRPQEAEGNFRAAIQLRPDEPMFHFALGIALSQRKNCAEAHDQFAWVLARNPDFPGAQSQLDACQPAPGKEQAFASGHSFEQ